MKAPVIEFRRADQIFARPIFVAAPSMAASAARYLLGGRAVDGQPPDRSIGWVEGIEINLLGAVAGVELSSPAIELPELGRLGLA